MADDKLKTYRGKRRFEATPEPKGASAPKRKAASGTKPKGASGTKRKGAKAPAAALSRFVIHEHHARRLHWDLRLEHDGALASWAVPNGIPPDVKENRLAVRTEDHPLEYLEFAGDIPRGEYGAGSIRIWDRGTFETDKWTEDKVEVTLAGERLTGRYALFRTKDADWMIHRMDPAADRQPMPERIVPMMARAATAVPQPQPEWSFEVKWDGVRAIAYVRPGRLRLESRNLNDITDTYPEVRGLLRDLGMRDAVLDGEIVAFDDSGRPSFERLQRRMHVTAQASVRRLAQSTPVVYAVFDVLYLDGRSLMEEPYSERRAALEGLGLAGAAWRVPAAHAGDGARLLEATRAQGLEGLIAKRLTSRYEPGRRSGAWLKVKHTLRQEFVIAGWLPGEGKRAERIGALIVGYRREGRLVYAGRVGTGFTEATLKALSERLAPLRRARSPFDEAPKLPREAVFVEPELVAEVEFREWTQDGVMRAPSFKGLRDDKAAREVEREAGGLRDEAELFDEQERLPEGARAVAVDGRQLKLTNWDKVLFPATGFTKGDLITYYARVAGVVVPHLRDRALTLKRYPNGVEKQYFYEKNSPSHRPDWVATERVGEIDYTLAQDRATLVWLANLADIELHTSLSRAREPDQPTMVAFDLDPGEPAGIVECCEVALVLRGLFEQLRLASFAKTSGSKGMQVYVPLNTSASYRQTKPFARRVAELLEQRLSELVVSRMTKRLRPGRVLVDWSQNDAHKTTVTVYSIRARERPTVSTPVTWEEVERCRANADAEALAFDAWEVLARVERHGDLFAPVETLKQRLPDV